VLLHILNEPVYTTEVRVSVDFDFICFMFDFNFLWQFGKFSSVYIYVSYSRAVLLWLAFIYCTGL